MKNQTRKYSVSYSQTLANLNIKKMGLKVQAEIIKQLKKPYKNYMI